MKRAVEGLEWQPIFRAFSVTGFQYSQDSQYRRLDACAYNAPGFPDN
jgi:hypothetical protein